MVPVQKKLISGLFWVLLLNVLIKPLWILGIEVGVQNAVGAEAYGFYFSIFNFAYIFNILLDFGITNFNTRNIAQHPHLINKYFGGILTIKLLLLAFYLVVTFTVGLLIGYNSHQFALLAILTFNQFLNSLILYLRSNFEGLLLFKWDSVLSVLDRLIMIIICGVLLLNNYTRTHFKIEYFVLAQTAAYVITTIVALATLLHNRQAHTLRPRLHFNKPFSLAILKQSAPFALLVLLMASFNRIDPVLLQRLLPDGDYQAGIYASAFRLLDALTMIAYLFSVPLLPIYSRLVKENSNQEISKTTKSMFSLVWVFSTTAAITLSTLASPLMELLYIEHTDASSQVFSILIYGIIPISFTYVFGTLLTANGSLKQLNIFAALSLVLNIGCNLWLIPRFAATGSAWASLTTQSFMAITQMVAAFRIFHLRISFEYLWRLLLFLCIVISINFFSHFSIWWHILIVSVIALIFAFLLFDFNLKQLFRNETKER